ncbi:hypothetical protein [Pseudonocardia sp. T1-2H]|uniref:hypothetical protein n=1 Tax=Pseudonocardia sp. T1-2H TaxID=3128899 RepID=UPI00310142D3
MTSTRPAPAAMSCGLTLKQAGGPGRLKVVEELNAADMLQASAPVPHRKQEFRALPDLRSVPDTSTAAEQLGKALGNGDLTMTPALNGTDKGPLLYLYRPRRR